VNQPKSRAKIFVDGHRILPALLADLAGARREIHLSMFLFFRDPIGLQVAEALAERARAGVDVRVLMNMGKTMGDPFSTGEKRMMRHDPNVDYDPLDIRPLCQLLTDAGARVLDTDIDYDRVIRVKEGRLASLAAQIRDSIDVDVMHVDHRKAVVIDGEVAYVGGANIGAQYLFREPFDPQVDGRREGNVRRRNGQPEPWWKWHDSLTRFEGPVVAAIDAEFKGRWLLDGGDEYESASSREGLGTTSRSGVERGDVLDAANVFTNSPDGQPNAIRELYLRLIGEAEHSIFIENPYLYHPRIVEALCAAKRRRPSLSVVLIVPSVEHNDNSFAADAQQHGYAQLLGAGVEVYEYQHHFNHLKIAVFDERLAIHGSTNLNFRSLENDKDFELVVLTEGRRFARRNLDEIRDVDLSHSRRITEREVRGLTLRALRIRMRHPWTQLLASRRLL
jgi:cardiolipin synthase